MQSINIFFRSLFEDCEKYMESYLSGDQKISPETFIDKRMKEWGSQLQKYGYPGMGSHGWLFQILIGQLVESYISKILRLKLPRVKCERWETHPGKADTSYYRQWNIGQNKIRLSINTSLPSMDKILPKIQPDVAVLVNDKVEVFLETKTYISEKVKDTRAKYMEDIQKIGNKNVINRLIHYNPLSEERMKKLSPIKVVCIKNGKETLNQVFEEIGGRLRTLE